MKMIIKEATTIQTTDGRGTNNNNQKRKGQSLVVALRNQQRRSRVPAREEEEEVLFFDTSQHEFSICRFLLVLIAIAFALIFLVEQFAPKDVYIHRTIQNGRNKAKVKVRDHARRAREAFRAYTAYDFEKANTREVRGKFEGGVRARGDGGE